MPGSPCGRWVPGSESNQLLGQFKSILVLKLKVTFYTYAISLNLSFFLVSAIFLEKQPVSRMNASFCLWITLSLFGQITGVVGQITGVVGQITGAIHRSIRTNYGRYPQI